MGLNEHDKIPNYRTPDMAYSMIRKWLKEKLKNSQSIPNIDPAFILDIPPVSRATTLEKRAIFVEVISGNLEWAYHESDGDNKMSAYANAGLRGYNFGFSQDEIELLKKSKIWPYLWMSRKQDP